MKFKNRWETQVWKMHCKSGKNYNAFSKVLGLQPITLRAFVHKLRNHETTGTFPGMAITKITLKF